MAPPTILAHKSAFLTAQTLQLSQDLAPSNAWRTSNQHSENSLSQRALDDALYRLNQTLQQHVRRVYPLQASRHVAEQIDGLFLDGGDDTADDERAHGDAHGLNGGELTDGVDFATDPAIATLPRTWDTHRPAEAEANPPEARRYADLQSSLTSLSARRVAARARVERLRRISGLLSPFDGDLQENLVTRNGEVEKELERMRVLLVRVAGRLAQLPAADHDPDMGELTREEDTEDATMEDLDNAERDKIQKLLDAF